jgi:hypothetical protein
MLLALLDIITQCPGDTPSCIQGEMDVNSQKGADVIQVQHFIGRGLVPCICALYQFRDLFEAVGHRTMPCCRTREGCRIHHARSGHGTWDARISSLALACR